MEIYRVLTNNAVIVKDSNNVEMIVCGKGIAFKKTKGDEIESQLINKTFILNNQEDSNHFKELIASIPIEYIQVASEIIEIAKIKLGRELRENLIVSLSDHIYMAVERFKENLSIKNGLLIEIQRFYEEEYEIGLEAISVIKKRLDIELPEDEAGFIALHIVNSEIESGNIQQMVDITRIIQEISSIVKFHYGIEFSTTSVYYYRFITHLKFFAQHLILNQNSQDSNDSLFEMIIVRYPESYNCVRKIGQHLLKKYEYKLQKEEMTYLMIHIERVVTKTSKDEK